MPLIQITTKPDYYPADYRRDDTANQSMTGEFAEALPALFVSHIVDFHMDADTPVAGVQVTHQKFHRRDVNAPDMWILIEFSEDGLDEAQQTEATGKVKKALLDWFEGNDYTLPDDYACDVRWSPSHGFLRIGGTVAEW